MMFVVNLIFNSSKMISFPFSSNNVEPPNHINLISDVAVFLHLLYESSGVSFGFQTQGSDGYEAPPIPTSIQPPISSSDSTSETLGTESRLYKRTHSIQGEGNTTSNPIHSLHKGSIFTIKLSASWSATIYEKYILLLCFILNV
jgi:hypothetical protein